MAIVIDENESGLDVEGSKLDALADLDEVCKTYPPLTNQINQISGENENEIRRVREDGRNNYYT